LEEEMVNKDFFLALEDLEREKGIKPETFLEALEAALVFAYKKNYGEASGISVKIYPDKNTIRVFATKTVVETVVDKDKEISVEDAKRYMKEGHFAPGSMLPKIEAALKFVESKPGRKAIITSLDKAVDALEGRAGTTLQ
jgi:hypothetical protein